MIVRKRKDADDVHWNSPASNFGRRCSKTQGSLAEISVPSLHRKVRQEPVACIKVEGGRAFVTVRSATEERAELCTKLTDVVTPIRNSAPPHASTKVKIICCLCCFYHR